MKPTTDAAVIEPAGPDNERRFPADENGDSSPRARAADDRRAASEAIKQGQFDRAELALRRLIEREPGDAATQHDLAVALARQGKLDEAIPAFERAIGLDPLNADTRRNLGVALTQRGRRPDAAASFQKAVDLRPESAQYRHDWASALKSIGKLEEAVAQYREAIRLKESWAEAHHDLGLTLADLKRPKEAEESYRQAISLKPDFPEALNNLGILLEGLGRLQEAEAAYRQALAIKPRAADVHNNLGVALAAQRKYEEAVASYRHALSLTPDSPLALNNLGNSLRALGQVDEAVRSLRQAIRLKPDYAEAYNNLGIALVQLGADDEAVTNYERALYFRPDYPEAHLNRSLAWLASGDFDRGWTEYEWRWMAKDVNRRSFKQRRWDGSDLHGRTIFVYLEQGVGDTLQFIRYTRLLKQRGARVIVEVQKSLARLVSTNPHIDEVVHVGAPAPEFDLQVPLLSLPALFRTRPDTIPADVPYLFPDPGLVTQWREKLGELCRSLHVDPPSPSPGGIPGDRLIFHQPACRTFKVGIAWQGNPQYRGDRQRSIPLESFAPLAAVGGVQLISLQKGHGAEQLVELAGLFSVVDPGPIDEQSGAFMDTAAIMKNLDLVVTSDTAMPHLAGALGVPVWMALPAVADWRWMREGEGCPWYPTMRAFRQREPNDWTELFERMAGELRNYCDPEKRRGSDRQAVSGASRPSPRAEVDARREHEAGLSAAKEGRLEEAEQHFLGAVHLAPDHAGAHHNLGVVQARRNQLSKAIKSFCKALEIDPKFADARGNLGLAYYEQGRFDDAVGEFRQALRLTPGSAETLNNLGAALVQLARPAEAADCYRRALELKPDYAEAHQNLGRAMLALGEMEQGFLEYEWRERLPGARKRRSDKPRWSGAPLAGKTLLVFAEQGLGDTLQFLRYARLAKEGGGRVILECQPELVPLLSQGSQCMAPHRDDIDQVIATGRPLPNHDLQAALMSLPALLRTTARNVPAAVPYVFADAALTANWRGRLDDVKGFKVGIAWQGNPAWTGDRYRSVPLDEFRPLAELPQVRLINLQKGAGAEQLVTSANHFPVIDFGTLVDGAAGPFMDTAAIMQNLDLVITSDTSIAHLAGAMGIPVWVALSYAPDWRWMMDRHDSPWYPTMRLFRQSGPGNWMGVFAAMARGLGDLLSGRLESHLSHQTSRSRTSGQHRSRETQSPHSLDLSGTDKNASSGNLARPESSAEIVHPGRIGFDGADGHADRNGHGRAGLKHGLGPGEDGKARKARIATINLTCPINQLGYGVVGRNILKGLTRAGVTVACWPIGPIDAAADEQPVIVDAIERQKEFDGGAPSIRISHQNHLAEHVGWPRIGFPIFELNRFTPTELNHLRSQDRLFVTCAWARGVVESNKAAPRQGTIDVVPLGVDRAIFHEPSDGNGIAEANTTVFLSIGKWERRKGHDVLLEAFNKAFTAEDDVELWMLTFNPVIARERSAAVAKNQQWETLYKSSPLASKIRILPRVPDQRDVAATMRQADCGVFLSRAEGWNLPALEMMSCGRQIIITNCSAHTEYCNSSNALLIEMDQLEDAYDERWFFGQGAWAAFGEQQLEQTIAHMRQVYQQKQTGRPMLNAAGIETAQKFSWDNTIQRLLAVL